VRGIGLARAALAIVAVIVIAWGAVLWRNDRMGYAAADRLFHGSPITTDGAWTHFLSQLEGAELLDPSTKWRVSRATALLLRDKPAAARLAHTVVEREPDNLEAWTVIYRAARGSDPSLARAALAQIERLNPVPPGS
jgi:hypothetical protein